MSPRSTGRATGRKSAAKASVRRATRGASPHKASASERGAKRSQPKTRSTAKGAPSVKPVRVSKAAKGGAQAVGAAASRLIDRRIQELTGWRGDALARVRALILEANPEIVEEWKWSNPVWSCGGIICTGEAYTKVVKLTFPKGASIPDPLRLFNSSLDGNVRRALDIREGDVLDAQAFRKLVRAAIERNEGKVGS